MNNELDLLDLKKSWATAYTEGHISMIVLSRALSAESKVTELQDRLTAAENWCAQQAVHVESLDKHATYLNELNAGLLIERDQLRAQLAEQTAPAESVQADLPVWDLSKTAWESIQQAARESTWIPPEYYANDWISDVCNFLRNGSPKVEQVSGGDEPVAQRITEQDARVIAMDAIVHYSHTHGMDCDEWMVNGGRTLLDKLNEHLQPVESDLHERLTAAETEVSHLIRLKDEILDRESDLVNERDQLREIIYECAKAVGAHLGSGVSGGFMADLPKEIEMCVSKLRAQLDEKSSILHTASEEHRRCEKMYNELLASFEAAKWQSISEAGWLKVWANGYGVGHNDGIGCGHSLAPRCKHNEDKLALDYINEIRELIEFNAAQMLKEQTTPAESVQGEIPVWYPHTATINSPLDDDLYIVDYSAQGLHGKINLAQALMHFNPSHGWRSKITPAFVGNKPKDSKYVVDHLVSFRKVFESPKVEQVSGGGDPVFCKTCNDSGEITVGIPHTMADSQEIACPDCSYEQPSPNKADVLSLSKQLEFVKAERDGYLKHRDQLLMSSPHWVEIDNPEDAPTDGNLVLWDGCDLSVDYVENEVDYGTSFFANGTEATHYLAGLKLPESESSDD